MITKLLLGYPFRRSLRRQEARLQSIDVLLRHRSYHCPAPHGKIQHLQTRQSRNSKRQTSHNNGGRTERHDDRERSAQTTGTEHSEITRHEQLSGQAACHGSTGQRSADKVTGELCHMESIACRRKILTWRIDYHCTETQQDRTTRLSLYGICVLNIATAFWDNRSGKIRFYTLEVIHGRKDW